MQNALPAPRRHRRLLLLALLRRGVSGGLSDRAPRALVDQGVLVRRGLGVCRRADVPPADQEPRLRDGAIDHQAVCRERIPGSNFFEPRLDDPRWGAAPGEGYL